VSSKDFDVGAYLGFWALVMVGSAVMFFFHCRYRAGNHLRRHLLCPISVLQLSEP